MTYTNTAKVEDIRAILAREINPHKPAITIGDRTFYIVPHTSTEGRVAVTRYNLELRDYTPVRRYEELTLSGLAAVIAHTRKA